MGVKLRLTSPWNDGREIDCDTEPSATIQKDGIGGGRIAQHELIDRPDDPTRALPPGVAKPPYHVPTMEAIRAREPNGYRMVSTFSGCGGSCVGFRMAGFRVLYANEFDEVARKSYVLNADPRTILDGRDIREVSAKAILDATGLEVGELDVFEGSPPCQTFSTAGGRNMRDSRTDLFAEYTRLVRELQPRVFAAENVSGMVKGVAKGMFIRTLASLKECGYRVEARMLDAQWLGVPQARQRIIFIGVRNDLELAPEWPTPLPYNYSIREALPWLSRVTHDTSGQWSQGVVTDRPSPTIMIGVGGVNSNHFKVEDDVKLWQRRNGFYGTEPLDADRPIPTVIKTQFSGVIEPETSLAGRAVGAEWAKLKPGEDSKKYLNLKRSSPDKPVKTVCSGGGGVGAASVTHPFACRKFTIAELKRLCAFPDDFVLTGTFAEQWGRLGNAVPPLMAAAIARSLESILRKADGGAEADA